MADANKALGHHTELVKGNPEDEVILVSFSPDNEQLVSGTPFCGKIEMMLRLAGIPYTAYIGSFFNKKHAPKRKMPTLHHGPNVVADSSCITEYLRNTYPEKMAFLFPEDPQRAAVALALQRMLEEDLYFCAQYCLMVPEVFYGLRDTMLGDFSPWLRPLVGYWFRNKMLRDLDGHGVGRHSYQFVQKRIEEELTMCSNLLKASGTYLTGDTPTSADCYLFGIIDTTVYGLPTLEDDKFAFARLLKQQPELMAFYERLKHQCFPSGKTDQFQKLAPF